VVDEGQEEFGKTQHSIGGRTDFERRLQTMILERLATSHQPSRKSVLIIGDSIRMRISDATGYGLHAYRELLSDVNVLHIPHNCGNSRVGVRYIQEWLKLEPDLVHFNFGLHDCSISPNTGKPTGTNISPDAYASNLNSIIEQIHNHSGARIIWASSTPVDEVAHRTIPGKQTLRTVMRRNDDIVLYNEIATNIMNDKGVPVNDLHSITVDAGINDCLLADGVHLNHFGGNLLGTQVAKACLDMLSP